jgi:PAS domain S-box-containing protein
VTPVLLLAVATVAVLLFVVDRVTARVRDDYDHFAIAAATSHVSTILDLAAAEVIALQLSDNPVVVDAKKASVQEAIRAFWGDSGLDGALLTSEGTILSSTLPPDATREAVAACGRVRSTVELDDGGAHCRSLHFPLWNWTAVTIARHIPLEQLRPELVYLPRFLLAGAVALTAAVLLLFWRFLSAPITRMVAEVAAGREVRVTGLAELDRVGAAVNSAVELMRRQTRELAEELELRHRVEAALREKEGHLRLLLDSTAEGIFGVDSAGICTFCNPAAVRLLGFASEGELLGKPIHERSHHTRADGRPYPAEECGILATREGRRAVRVADEVFWRADGTKFPVEYWACPVIDQGAVTGAVVGFIDITDRQALEEQLRQSQKMEAVGRLAGGIAHDFNNLLTAIVGFATVAREEGEPGSSQVQSADQVLAAAAKATDLTRQILAFSRKQVISPAPVDVNEIIRGMARLLGRVLGEDVEVALDLAPGALVTMADRAQIEQVLMNLSTNARDAMPRGGRLSVTTRQIVCDARTAATEGLEAPGRYALVTVADSGVGMDEATCRRVFEPFFTTKELGKGTGLGLSIVYGIVRQHRGQIGVSSQPGRGTSFRIHLRLTDGATSGAVADAPVAVRGGTETVLMAEDNAEVRALVRSVLQRAGYRVLAANDGEEALELHRAHAEEVALCLLDVVMPRRSGLEVMREVRARKAGVRVVLMSGYAPELAGGAPVDGPDAPLLVKPFTPGELLRRVREALDR